MAEIRINATGGVKLYDIEKIDIPSKAPGAYTKTELLTLMDKDHWDDMFNKKYAYHISVKPVETTDNSFDVGTLGE